MDQTSRGRLRWISRQWPAGAPAQLRPPEPQPAAQLHHRL